MINRGLAIRCFVEKRVKLTSLMTTIVTGESGLQEEPPTIEIIHFADPWCWWSWGLEPILGRLKEVYGEGVKVTYRMGGITDSIDEWRKEYNVVDDKSLKAWITDSVSLTKMPIDPEFILKSRAKSTWPACIAFKAAQLQNGELADLFFRKLMESIQVEAKNASNDAVYLKLAKEIGLDPIQLKKEIRSGSARELFEKDHEAMNVNFLTLAFVNKRNGKSKTVGEVFTIVEYEKAVDELSGGSLRKRTPVDILGYFERHQRSLVSAREIAIIFGTTEKDAQQRLEVLSKGELLERKAFGFGATFWTVKVNKKRKIQSLTMEELNASHVSEPTKNGSEPEVGEVITNAVKNLYTEVATNPNKAYHFPLGRKAARFVGYPKTELDNIPETAVESFAGVGYPHATNAIQKGDTVLDIGSGSGTDVLVSSLRTGPQGNVIGLDITDAMIEKARKNIAKMEANNVRILKGGAEKIPLENSSVDVVTSNGVLNLVPDKKKAFQEIYRVLKPGGRIQIADIVVQKDVQKACGLIPQLWADCIGGASVEDEYLRLINDSGFKELKVINRLDYFSESSSDNTKRLTKTFEAQTIVLTALKPA